MGDAGTKKRTKPTTRLRQPGGDAQSRVIEIPLALVDASAGNPRLRLRDIDELAASIAAYGLLQAVVVRPTDGRYVLVAGHRRLAAVQSLGWTRVPATVREVDDSDAYVLTLVENLQRNDLSPREEAQALEVLIRERSWSTRQVAAAVHRSAAYVSKRLRVFEDPVLAPLVLQQRLSTSAAEELLVLEPRRRRELAQQAVQEAWDHPQVRTAVRACFEPKRRQPLRGLARKLRDGLQGIFPAQLSESERRELRLLFQDLAVIARAPSDRVEPVFPRLPQ
jgi:ParB/RepB/Spo0J family partition protein